MTAVVHPVFTYLVGPGHSVEGVAELLRDGAPLQHDGGRGRRLGPDGVLADGRVVGEWSWGSAAVMHTRIQLQPDLMYMPGRVERMFGLGLVLVRSEVYRGVDHARVGCSNGRRGERCTGC